MAGPGDLLGRRVEETVYWQKFFQARKNIPVPFRRASDRVTSVLIPLALGGAGTYLLGSGLYRLINGQKKL
eukprot:PRCOL_00005148-RA